MAGVAGAGVGPALEDQDDGVVERAAPGVLLAVGVAQVAAVFAACGAELAEGDRVGAGFGQAVPAVAQGVCPFAQPGVPGGMAGGQVPGGGHHLPVVAVAAQGGDGVAAGQPPVGQAGGGEALGDVLGDVVGHGLGAAALLPVAGRTGPGRTGRVSVCGPNVRTRTSAAGGGLDAEEHRGGGVLDGLAQQLGGPERAGWLVVVGGGVEAEDGVEVDHAAGLVFG